MAIMLHNGRTLADLDAMEARAEMIESEDDLDWMLAVENGPVPDEALL